jgi:hypothetical protein
MPKELPGDQEPAQLGKTKNFLEPNAVRSVQPSMVRVKNFVASLLSAFLLVVLAHASLEPSACGWAAEGGAAGSLPDDSSPGSGLFCSATPVTIHRAVRRHGGGGAQSDRFLGPVSPGRPVSPRNLTSAIPPAGESLLLQQRWQFVWRTADSVRAPSFRA